MSRHCATVTLAVAVCVLLAGCGGGGGRGSSPPPSSGGGGENNIPANLPVSVQAIGDLKTVPLGTICGIVGVGYHGATITRLELRAPRGRIAFLRTVSGVDQVFVANPDGSNASQLTFGGTHKQGPRFSPDGTQIAYASDGRIYVMNADGTRQQVLPTDTINNQDPCWGEQWLYSEGEGLFYAGEFSGQKDIFQYPNMRVTDTTAADRAPDVLLIQWAQLAPPYPLIHESWDGDWEICATTGYSDSRKLTDNSAQDLRPRWSPDGGSIVFASNRDGNYEIYKMDAAGGNQQRLTNDAAKSDVNPVWSPDGTEIMWCKTSDLWIMNADGSNQRAVATNFGKQIDWWGPIGHLPRVFIGPAGSDYGGGNPPLGAQRECAIFTVGRGAYCVTVGASAGKATIESLGLGGEEHTVLLVEVRAEAGTTGIDSVLEDRGPKIAAGVYNLPDTDPGSGVAYPQSVVLAFDAEIGRLITVLAVRVAAAPAQAGKLVQAESAGGQVAIRGPFVAVYTCEDPSRNLAPNGASTVVLNARSAKVLSVE